MSDYSDRSYLSSTEAAKYLGTTVSELLALARKGALRVQISGSGQKRFSLADLKALERGARGRVRKVAHARQASRANPFEVNATRQAVIVGDAAAMTELKDNSVHLMVTSPPYFNAKMYSNKPLDGDLGNIHDLDSWFLEIGKVWSEVFRVLQPGRKAFINIMNLPIRNENGGFRCLNLVGRTIDLMEKIGFVFKRDIIWHKTNGVRAHFGSYPLPGGILINNMHESILEFDKPAGGATNKYGHLTAVQKEASKLDKDFWLSVKNSDVWTMKPQNSGDKRSHVAPFPLELPARLIRAFSFVSETVLDPFLGSGTTLIAAADLGRNGIGYELIPDIAEVALEQLKMKSKVHA